MRIGRTLPPAAAPIGPAQILVAIAAACAGEQVVERFAAELRDYFRVRYCLCAGSGRAALTLVLAALQQKDPRRDTVLVPAFCCYSVAAAVKRAGLKLALCDIDPDRLDFDFAQLAPRLDNPRLLAVIGVDLFGRPADIGRLLALRSDPAVTIIEDAAQAFAAESAGIKLGTRADVGLFSLGRGKALTAGEGGIVVTNRDDLAALFRDKFASLTGSAPRSLRLWLYAVALGILQHPSLYWLPNALPFLRLGQTLYDPNFGLHRFAPSQAGLAHDWCERSLHFRSRRRRQAADWAAFLASHGQQHYLQAADDFPDLLRFPWRVSDQALRQRILAESRRQGLGIAASYPATLARIPQLAADFAGQDFPGATAVAASLLTLPLHPLLKLRDMQRIKHVLHELLVATEPVAELARPVRIRAMHQV